MPSLPLVGEDFAGYRLRAVLGRGGMSVVYEAENARLGNTVALKLLAPELATNDAFRARFLKESRLAASLNHPNVIPIYDMGPCDDMLYIAMRYVAGSDLRSVLTKQGLISPSQALLLVGQAGRALDAAHRAGLVHRDVKPANVLIERGENGDPDHVYLSDFGLTKHQLSRSGLTETGELLGTIDYIAPEQIQGKDVDGRADIYSLGCVLYECLTGRVPFVKDIDAAVIWAHVEELPTPPSAIRADLPGAIDEVIMRALAKDPNDRYPTCRELVAAAYAATELPGQPSGTQAPEEIVPAGAATVLSTPEVPEPAPMSPPTVLSAAGVQEPARAVPAPAGATSGTPPDSQGGAAIEQEGSHEPLSVTTGPGMGSSEAAMAALPAEPAAARERTPEPSVPREPRRGDRQDSTSRRPWYAVAVVALAGAAAAVLVLTTSSSTNAGEASTAALEQVPTNHVTGGGSAIVRLNGSEASVTVTTSGLDNNDELTHPVHIHAGGRGECPPASAARLHNGHLSISTLDGVSYYGPPVIALTTRGDFSPQSILAFPRFLTGGTLHYARTITLPPFVVADIRRNNGVVVVHGVDYDGSGIYSGVLDRSELDRSVPATATAPALCGVLVAKQQAASVRSRSRQLVFMASLTTFAEPPSEWTICGPGEAAATFGEPRGRVHLNAAT